jgi:hypothetical protein
VDPIAFVRRHGIVLESARGPVPSLAETVAGAPIRGSWWSHPKGNAIFELTRTVRDHPDILTCRLVNGKITFVHRRLWPALVRLAGKFAKDSLAAIREEHTPSGAHRVSTIPFPRWVPDEVKKQAKDLGVEEAEKQIGGIAP